MPAEFTQGLGANQPATALQGVEHATDRTQVLGIVRRTAPDRQQLVQVVDLFLEFFEEDLPDFVIDFFASSVEPGTEHGHAGLGGHDGRWRRRLDGRFLVGLFHGVICIRLLYIDFIHGFLSRGNIDCAFHPATRQRPVRQGLQAIASLVEQVLALAMRIVQGLEVILHPGQRIRQGIQVTAARNLALADQFDMTVTTHCLQVTGRLGKLQDAHRACDLGQQAWHGIQCCMIPVGFDECDECIAHFDEVGGGLEAQRTHDLARFLREQVVGIGARTGIVLPKPGNLVVQRMFDVDQCAGHVEQFAFGGWPLAIGDRMHGPGLLVDHPTRSFQANHGKGFADTVQRFRLRLEHRAIGLARTQVQVQGVLDPQQVFLERCRYRIQQRTVAPGQAATGVFKFGLGRLFQQARQRILRHGRHASRRTKFVE